MLTFAGRHDNCSKNLRGPTYTTIPCEILRRFSCQVFITDKFLATLVGRPPLLSRRFCSVELPLDIDDVTLLTDKESFDRCRESLDSDGWATDGRFRAVTVLRIRMKIALIRDRILEFVMGHDCVHDNRDLLYVNIWAVGIGLLTSLQEHSRGRRKPISRATNSFPLQSRRRDAKPGDRRGPPETAR